LGISTIGKDTPQCVITVALNVIFSPHEMIYLKFTSNPYFTVQEEEIFRIKWWKLHLGGILILNLFNTFKRKSKPEINLEQMCQLVRSHSEIVMEWS